MKRRGFTLLETLLALAISTTILGAITSLFVLMARSLPDNTSALARTNQMTRAVDRFAFDVSWALQVVSATPNRVELTLPDTDGDGARDSVVYAWTGSGSSWTRSINGGTAETICKDVGNIAFVWRARKVTGATTAKTLENVRIEITPSNAGAKTITAGISACSHARVP